MVPEQAGEAVCVEDTAVVGDGHEGTRTAMLGGTVLVKLLQQQFFPGSVRRHALHG